MAGKTHWVTRLGAVVLLLSGIPFAFAGVPSPAIDVTLPHYAIRGEITAPGQINSYKFSGNAGQEVALWTLAQSIGSTLVPIIALYDTTGKLIAYNDFDISLIAGGVPQDSTLFVKLPATGTYYASVLAAADLLKNSTAGGRTGFYTFFLDSGSDYGRITDPYEPNDTPRTATQITPPFASYGANLLYFGDIDWYSLAAKKGQRFLVDVDAAEMKHTLGWEAAVKARVGVFDLNGQLLLSSEHGVDLDSGYGEDPALIFTAPQDGTYCIAVTSYLDTHFHSVYSEEAFLADPYVGSRTGRIGQYILEVREITTLLFPQVANGSFGEYYFKTSIILVNSSAAAAAGKISFYGSDGSPLEVSLESGELVNTWYFNIPAKTSYVLKTGGDGAGASGYAVVLSDTPIGGSTVFSQYGPKGNLVTEAGVSSGSIMDYFAIPVDTTGEFNTGVAILNSESTSAVGTYLRLLDSSGKTVASRTISLLPGHQIAQFVFGSDQLFPNVGKLRGSLQVFSDSPVTTVALRSSAKTLTTLAPSAVNQSYEASSMIFPQVVTGAAGQNYRTLFMLSNTGYFTVNGTIRLTRSDGTPMGVQIGTAQSSLHSFSIPPLSTVFLEASSSGGMETGYATVTANHGLGGAAVISQYSAAGVLECEVGVGPAQKFSHFFVFAENLSGYNTGVALANPDSVNSTVEYELRPSVANSQALHKGPVALNSGQHRADLISGQNQLFPAFTGLGTLEVVSAIPVPAIALRISAGTMTSLPVIPAPAK
jgi:hypothetical protein